MRRLVLLIFASSCLIATGPATALAAHHHHHHHARHHVRHQIRRFGAPATQPSPSTSPTASPTAGTVVSFTGGILTIMLNDQSTVSGAVTNDTEIECRAMESDVVRDGGPGRSGGDHGGDHGDGGDDQGEDGQSCATTALVKGATVNGAELRLSASGATWSKVELG